MFELLYTIRTDAKDYNHVAVETQHRKDITLARIIIVILSIIWVLALWIAFEPNLVVLTFIGAVSVLLILHFIGFVFDQLAKYAFHLHLRD